MSAKGYRYRIDVSDVDEALKIISAVDGARAEPGTIKDSINVIADQDLARQINHALVSAGVGVDQLVRTEQGLEDVYIELTGVPVTSPLSSPVAPQ